MNYGVIASKVMKLLAACSKVLPKAGTMVGFGKRQTFLLLKEIECEVLVKIFNG
jgi:hypothetical protein